MDSISDRDPHRPYPDAADDAVMDAAEQAWIRQQEADDACRDDEQAEEAMTATTDDDDLADLREAARVQRERADAEMAEAERLEALADRTARSTSAIIAGGNMSAVDLITGLFKRGGPFGPGDNGPRAA